VKWWEFSENTVVFEATLPGPDHPGWSRLHLSNWLHAEHRDGRLRIVDGRARTDEPPPDDIAELLAEHRDVLQHFITRHEQEPKK
jgi:hypothetical protein